ncbi:hypothetical protein EDB85DRAFT_759230 [Lactarius pseudohatsudake]|nr:hypothetical protein EDB85DRAFT_759230 [Lactarius pseudohatsudake]
MLRCACGSNVALWQCALLGWCAWFGRSSLVRVLRMCVCMCAYVCRGSESRHGSLIEWHSNPSHSTASGLCRERQQVQDWLRPSEAALRTTTTPEPIITNHTPPTVPERQRASCAFPFVPPPPPTTTCVAIVPGRVSGGPWSVPSPLRRT